MKLTPHEEKVLELIRNHPEIINDPVRREQVAQENGLTEKTLRNRIGDLKKYGVLKMENDLKSFEDEMPVFAFFKIAWLYKTRIALITTIVIVLSIILALLMPLTFRATAVIMSPSSENTLGISSMIGNLPLGGLLGGNDSNSMILLAILNSRKIAESTIKEFNLLSLYKSDFMDDGIEEFHNNTDFKIEEEGTITISANVTTGWLHQKEEIEFSKKLAQDIVNYIVDRLDEVNKALKTETAISQREFIEDRYKMNIKELKIAEDKLNIFQEEKKILALTEQTVAAITAAATIKGEILSNEVKYELLKQSLPSSHPDVLQLATEIALLKNQLKQMEEGELSDGLFPQLNKVPDLSIELARLKRDLEVQNTLFMYLTQQYEEAKIKEAKNTPTIQVLDYAEIPDKKYKPSRTRIVIIGFLFSLIATTYTSYFLYKIKRVNDRI